MKKHFTIPLLCSSLIFQQVFALQITLEDAHFIGEKIWKNECRGTVDGLTSWNLGENFASLGIGHFIWYAENKDERFHEMFPELLEFLKNENVAMPEWLKSSSTCPWGSRDEFYRDFHGERMKTLRKFLCDTKDLQAAFIAKRLEQVLPQMLKNCSDCEKKLLNENFSILFNDTKGLYALIDYLNFKGAGTSSKETYSGKGWGLQQVLLRLPTGSSHPLSDFISSAKKILTERVNNAPKERNEKRWLEGWFNRLDTYAM